MPDRFNEPPYDPRLDPRDRRYDPRFDPRDDPRFERDYDPRQDPRYDYRDDTAPGGAARSHRDRRAGGPAPIATRRQRLPLWAILAGLVALLLVGFFAYRLTQAGPGQDRLNENATDAAGADATTAEERCGSQRTYDLVKQQLFRQAAQVRGSDQAAFDRLSAYAAVRVTSPVLRREDEELGTIVCGGTVALDLPPGVAVVGGRRTLQADVDYSLQPAADGSGNVVTLSGADAIVVPLATLARTGSQPGLPQAQPQPGEPQPEPVQPGVIVPPAPGSAPNPPSPPAPPAVEPTPTTSARPSFDCARARTRGEVAVCNSSELATLDRQMASFFNSARREADPGTRALLDRTRGRFLAFRDRCRNDRCIADAYRGRITEIRDIVDGRWQER
jgi:hypothetical protein